MIDYNTPLIQISRPLDADIIRKAVIANAYAVKGFSATNKRKEFEDLLGPVKGKWDLDRPFKVRNVNGKYITEGVSTCALVLRGLWRRMNVDMDALYKNYIFGTAISAEITFARKNKCWQPNWKERHLDLRPEPGDYVVVGTGLSTHVLMVVRWEDDICVSIDGGQLTNKNLQCVKEIKRKWVQKKVGKNIEPYLDSRKVLGWVVFDMMPFKGETMIVPKGWSDIY